MSDDIPRQARPPASADGGRTEDGKTLEAISSDHLSGLKPLCRTLESFPLLFISASAFLVLLCLLFPLPARRKGADPSLPSFGWIGIKPNRPVEGLRAHYLQPTCLQILLLPRWIGVWKDSPLTRPRCRLPPRRSEQREEGDETFWARKKRN